MSATPSTSGQDAASASVTALAAKMLAQANANAAVNAPEAAAPAAPAPAAPTIADPVATPGAEQAASQAPTPLSPAPATPTRKKYYCSQENSTFIFSNGKVVRFAGGWYHAKTEQEEAELDAIVGTTHVYDQKDAPQSAAELLLAAIQHQQAQQAATAQKEVLAAAQRGEL